LQLQAWLEKLDILPQKILTLLLQNKIKRLSLQLLKKQGCLDPKTAKEETGRGKFTVPKVIRRIPLILLIKLRKTLKVNLYYNKYSARTAQ
jgi:hypothetical protein